MLDFCLAELYDVETKRLKEAVRRNIDRFPDDFMFEMTREEYGFLRTQFASLEKENKPFFNIQTIEEGKFRI